MALQTSEDFEEKVSTLGSGCESETIETESCREYGIFGQRYELLFFFLILVILFNELYYS